MGREHCREHMTSCGGAWLVCVSSSEATLHSMPSLPRQRPINGKTTSLYLAVKREMAAKGKKKKLGSFMSHFYKMRIKSSIILNI